MLRRWILLLPLCTVVLGFALTAGADSPAYPTINVTLAGTDKPVPFNSSFYLAGSITKDTDRVQAIIARKGERCMFGSDGPDCHDVRATLERLMDDSLPPGIRTPAALFDYANKQRNAQGRTLISPPPSGFIDDAILVTDAWIPRPKAGSGGDKSGGSASSPDGSTTTILVNVNVRTDVGAVALSLDGGAADGAAPPPSGAGSDDAGPGDAEAGATQDFKLFVPASNQFFLPGSTYCLFVFQHKKKTDSHNLLDSLMTFVEGVQLCDRAEKSCLSAGGPVAACYGAYTACVDQKRGVLRSVVQSVVATQQGHAGPPSPGEVARIDAQVLGEALSLLHTVSGLEDSTRTVRRALSEGLVVTDRAKLSEKNLKDAALLLVKMKDKLDKKPVDDPVDVQILDLGHAAVTRRGGGKPAKGAAAEVVELDKLFLPNSTVSLRDVIELAYGRISIDGSSYLAAQQARSILEPTLRSMTAYAERDRTTLHGMRDRLRAIEAEVRHLVSIQANASAPGLQLQIEQALDKWLTPALVPCAGPGCVALPAAPTPPPPGHWPGYPNDDSPLATLADAFSNLEQHHDALVGAVASGMTGITTSIETTGPATVPLTSDYTVSQKLWVSSYLMPVVGAVIAMPKGADPIIAPYAGVQLHFYPNPIEDPLWTHGFTKDWTRAWAVEIGLAANNGPFGPDNRFRGPGAFAPVLVGAAVHLIPYTSLTGGVAIFDQQSSTLSQQQYQLTAVGFVAVNVTANIPDLVRAIMVSGAASSIAAAKGN